MRRVLSAMLVLALVAFTSTCNKSQGPAGSGSWTIEPAHGVFYPLHSSGKPLALQVKITPSDNTASYFVSDISESQKGGIQFPLTNLDSLGMRMPSVGPSANVRRWANPPDYLLIFNDSTKTITLTYAITEIND